MVHSLSSWTNLTESKRYLFRQPGRDHSLALTIPVKYPPRLTCPRPIPRSKPPIHLYIFLNPTLSTQAEDPFDSARIYDPPECYHRIPSCQDYLFQHFPPCAGIYRPPLDYHTLPPKTGAYIPIHSFHSSRSTQMAESALPQSLLPPAQLQTPDYFQMHHN
ncbi:hypothetical protein IMSAGC022_00329 [Alistipes sp.]|nr:hypothetical protein IMSAGC022_00329 [Alistipes sp.]